MSCQSRRVSGRLLHATTERAYAVNYPPKSSRRWSQPQRRKISSSGREQSLPSAFGRRDDVDLRVRGLRSPSGRPPAVGPLRGYSAEAGHSPCRRGWPAVRLLDASCSVEVLAEAPARRERARSDVLKEGRR